MKTVGIGLAYRPRISFAELEAIADAAARAMFITDGREEDTASAKCLSGSITATRRFKAQLRRELRAANFTIWAKGRTWA